MDYKEALCELLDRCTDRQIFLIYRFVTAMLRG